MKLRKILKLHLFAMLMTTGVSHAQTSSTEVLLETTAGTIRIALYDETPLHRDNFLKHCREHRYDSLLFHRVINNFMIQAGDIHSKHAQPGQLLGGGDLNYTVEPEFRLPSIYHCRGAVAMAREGDSRNPEMRSSACQFYIVTRRNGTPHLDGKYTVFGIVKEGMEIADQIQTVATDQFDRPLKDIRILSTKIIESVQLPADGIQP
ncbi:MAG: peptidylprolyl isomerase [Prevotella sp.]|nr:peptidylprolyl isomerase [Prevotella sp.]